MKLAFYLLKSLFLLYEGSFSLCLPHVSFLTLHKNLPSTADSVFGCEVRKIFPLLPVNAQGEGAVKQDFKETADNLAQPCGTP